jgi:hypothetical protein
MDNHNHSHFKERFPGLGARAKAPATVTALRWKSLQLAGGSTPQPLVQLERHDNATTPTLNYVAKALGVSVDELTGRKAGAP